MSEQFNYVKQYGLLCELTKFSLESQDVASYTETIIFY